MGRRQSGGARPARRRLSERRRILLTVEGKTEQEYFKWLNDRIPGLHLEVEQRHSSPERVVDRAVTLRDSDRQQGKQAGDPGGYDDVWAVVDVDTHAHLANALEMARREGLSVAVSGPSFETWLLIHLRSHSQHTTAQELKKRWLKASDGRSVESGVLVGMLSVALGHAVKLRGRCERDRIDRTERNPCTEVDLLITAIADLLGVDPQSLY